MLKMSDKSLYKQSEPVCGRYTRQLNNVSNEAAIAKSTEPYLHTKYCEDCTTVAINHTIWV